jgi:hypothetical protein
MRLFTLIPLVLWVAPLNSAQSLPNSGVADPSPRTQSLAKVRETRRRVMFTTHPPLAPQLLANICRPI